LSGTKRAVNAFFESYRAAFERLDAPAIADHFAYPGHITSDTGEIVLVPITTKHEWIGQIERLLTMYRAVGFASARALKVDATELSPRLVQTLVHWAPYDDAARLLYEFEATYTLAGSATPRWSANQRHRAQRSSPISRMPRAAATTAWMITRRCLRADRGGRRPVPRDLHAPHVPRAVRGPASAGAARADPGGGRPRRGPGCTCSRPTPGTPWPISWPRPTGSRWPTRSSAVSSPPGCGRTGATAATGCRGSRWA